MTELIFLSENHSNIVPVKTVKMEQAQNETTQELESLRNQLATGNHNFFFPRIFLIVLTPPPTFFPSSHGTRRAKRSL